MKTTYHIDGQAFTWGHDQGWMVALHTGPDQAARAKLILVLQVTTLLPVRGIRGSSVTLHSTHSTDDFIGPSQETRQYLNTEVRDFKEIFPLHSNFSKSIVLKIYHMDNIFYS